MADVMTAAEAHRELKDLHGNHKRRLPELTKRALEYAMTMIVQKLGEEALELDQRVAEQEATQK